MFRKYLAAVALAAVLAACGGGADSVQTQSVSPQAAAAAMRAGGPLRATRATTSLELANQLLNAAEVAYPQYFPSRQETQSFAPFFFRYYPETGIYLGLVVQTSSFYLFNGVYAAGAPFGSLDNPTYIGKLTDFITPGSTASACFDLALFDTPGTRMTIAYNYVGESGGTETVETTVGGMTTFEGHMARETSTLVTGTVSGSDGFSYSSTGHTYGARTGTAEVTQYGSVSVLTYASSGLTITSSMRTVLTPPYVDTQYLLAQGASTTATQSGSTTTTTSRTGAPDETATTAFSVTTTTKYAGQETITVPAGTFDTCKFESTTDGSPGVTTAWFIAGKGIHVKSAYTGMTVEATSVTLNGVRL